MHDEKIDTENPAFELHMHNKFSAKKNFEILPPTVPVYKNIVENY